MEKKHSRRNVIKELFGGIIASIFLSCKAEQKNKYIFKGNINHSVCRWTYDFLSVEELCIAVKDIGFHAIDLVSPADWPMLQKHGIHCAMCFTAGEISITKGWGNKNDHESLIKDFLEIIPMMVKAGYKNVVCSSGSRNGMDDSTGLDNCIQGLQKVLPVAEKNGITIHMELLNSRVDHKDYLCDKTAWGVELCKRVGSPNFKLLYDIYHMQTNEGNIIKTIRENEQWIGHYHTGGVPGRHEIDESQELNYPAIMKAIVKTGYKGYVGQEFVAAEHDKVESLRKAVQLCDV